MIPSLQSTDILDSVYPRSRSRILNPKWKVDYGQSESQNSTPDVIGRQEDLEGSEVATTPQLTLMSRGYLRALIFEREVSENHAIDAVSPERPEYKFIHHLDSSTSLPDLATDLVISRSVKTKVQRLFSLVIFIDLEPGMTNEFSEGLEDVIERYGKQALCAIEDTILDENTKSSIAMEALRYIGYTNSEKWHDERRRTIERCLLRSPSAWVRDGAGLGLASLDDPKSIPALEKAILNETSGALKEDLTLVLHQLLDTLREQ